MSKHTTETGTQVSLKIVQRVAEKTGREPSEMEPLSTVVDTDALNTLFQGASGSVSFLYEGYRITVSADGAVTVENPR